MQNNNEHIDELFRTSLTGYQVTPPPNVWDNIAASMAAKQKKHRTLFIWGLSSAASVAIAFMLGWMLSDKPSTYEIHYANIEKIKQECIYKIPNSDIIEKQIKLKQHQTQLLPILNQKNNLIQKTHKTTISNKRDNTIIPLLLTKNTNTIKTKRPQHDLIQTNNICTKLSIADQVIIEKNLLALNNIHQQNEYEKNKKQWAVGLIVSPQTRFEEISTTNNADYATAPQSNISESQNSINTDYESNISAGLSIEFNANKKLSFVSGVNYNEIRQTAKNIALAYAGHNWAVYANEADFITGTTRSENIDERNTITLINTDIGLANINMPAGVKLAKTSYLYSQTTMATESYNFEQNAGYIEIPFLVKYQLNDKKIRIHLSGGINTNILISNNVNLSQNESTVASGNIEGLREINFSSSIGAGANYNITKWLNFSIEPMFKFQLNSISELQNYDIKPYTFGIYSGIQYLF